MGGNNWSVRGITVMGLLLTTACDEPNDGPSDDRERIEITERSGSDPSAIVAGMGLGDGESWVVVASGEVKGWGQRYCDSSGCREPLEIEAIDLGGQAVEVHGNGSFTAALMADGTVLGFGPTAADALAPVPVDFEQWVVELAVGLDFVCGRFAGGEISCRALEGVPAPAWLAGFESIGDAVELTAGAEHACARRASGNVVCWGSNDAGQLGSSSATGTVTIALSGATQVAAGGDHTCARLELGEVVCWGSNAEGQLGHPGSEVGLVALEPVAQIAAGAEHSCAIGASTGDLYCWGSNALGQLGAGEDSSTQIRRVDLGGLRATAVFAGATAWTTFAVLETGGLRGWGNDDSGQTGYGDRFRGDGQTTRNAGDLPDIPIFIPPDEE